MNTPFKSKHTSVSSRAVLLSVFFYTIPFFVASAQTPQDAKGVLDLFKDILLNSALPFLISLGLVLFLIGVVRFVGAGDNEEKRQGGRAVMLYGIVVLFVMIAVWGLVAIFTQTLEGGDPTLPFLPDIK